MQSVMPCNRGNRHRVPLLLIASTAILGCSPDAPGPVDPLSRGTRGSADASTTPTITVSTSADLASALSAANAGTRIHLRAGSYTVDHPLIVPDGAVLEGDGVMQFDRAGRPAGFAPDTRTTVTMTANIPGDVLTLGNGATLRQLAIVDLPGRAGNAIGVVSRAPRDSVSAAVAEVEVFNPNPHGNSPLGPTGCGLAVVTRNPNLGGDPPPHEGATLVVSIERSLIHAPAAGSCGLFAFNFAARGIVSVSVANNVVGGGMVANGGVSRTDAVHDARVRIESRNTLYRQDYANACADRRLGWNLTGGSGAPLPLVLPATERNTLELHSTDDRIEGFTTAVFAIGSRRFFNTPVAGPNNGNGIELQMLRTTIATPSCGGVDLELVGAMTAGAFWPGDGNYVRALLRGVTGSGTRANIYANAMAAAGALPEALQGTGNRLEIIGSPQSFDVTNARIDPAPGAAFFTAGSSQP